MASSVRSGRSGVIPPIRKCSIDGQASSVVGRRRMDGCRVPSWAGSSPTVSLTVRFPFRVMSRSQGFLEVTPVQKRLFDALQASDIQVRERPVPDTPGEAVRVGLVDTEREIRAAAQWSRQILETDPEAARPRNFESALLWPILTDCRRQLERIFAEEFHPGGRFRPGPRSPAPLQYLAGPAGQYLPDHRCGSVDSRG